MENFTPADVGSIIVQGTYNYSIKLLSSVGSAGARNLGASDLRPSGDRWSSLISAGDNASHITGDLTGALTLKADSSGNGGELNLAVDGNVSSSASIETDGELTLFVGGDVEQSARIETEHVNVFIVGSAYPPNGSMSGTLLVHGGLRYGEFVEVGTLDYPGAINFENNPIAGFLSLWYGGSGEVFGGTIVGTGNVLDESGAFLAYTDNPPSEFSGTATFAGTDNGVVYANNLSGRVHFTGDVAGLILIQQMTGSSRLAIDGSLLKTDLLADDVFDIYVPGGLDESSAITVDYDGWDAGDDWQACAIIGVGTDPATYARHRPENGPICVCPEPPRVCERVPRIQELTSCV